MNPLSSKMFRVIEVKKAMNGGTFIEENIFYKMFKSRALYCSNKNNNFNHMIKAIKRFYNNTTMSDEQLIIAYYCNENQLQDIIKLEFIKHLTNHADKITKECIRCGELIIPEFEVKELVISYMYSIFNKRGIFDEEMAWFLSESNGGGIFGLKASSYRAV